ncbi:hypothetical protein AX16_002444 [Volvariella volvacea WC 439]|nr:hypothetical protein AX16_002444 [Volvariella volvacea WC 439]
MPPKNPKGKQKAKEKKPQVCRLVNSPGGCKRQNCQFSHDVGTSAGPSASANASTSSRQTPTNTNQGTSTPRHGSSNWQGRRPSNANANGNGNKGSDVPHGVCKSFWSNGQCPNANCALRHMQAPDASTTSTSAASPEAMFQSSSSLNVEASSPAEVNGYLWKFLKDDYRFRKTVDVYAFVRLLSMANTQNSSWTSEDGQLLLGRVSEGNGLLRIVDVLIWQPMSVTAGRNMVTLSFQRAYIPLMKFLASDVVAKTTMSHQANLLYTALINNLEQFWTNLSGAMTSVMSRGSFKDGMAPAQKDSASAMQVFMSLTSILYECLSRFKNLSVEKPLVTTIVQALEGWVATFVTQVRASSKAFDGAFDGMEPNQRDHILEHLQNKLERLVHIADRGSKRAANVRDNPTARAVKGSPDEGLVAHLNIAFEGPGNLRTSGPRHDNDDEDIHNISIAPTHEELLCELAPYLPANFDGAPHHLPQRSVERHLDVQFRLLREELIAPLRMAIQLVHADLQNRLGKTKLAEILKKKGGKYRGNLDMQDGIMFNVYTGVEFKSITTDRRGITIELFCSSPPGNARNQNAKVREAFWEKMSGKRLMTGGLISLVWQYGSSVSVELGTVSSTMDDLKKAAKSSADKILLRISFFNPEFELRVLKLLHYESNTNIPQTILLVESPVLYESIRPFLEALLVEPESVALGNHIVKPFNQQVDVVPPPVYARSPGFSFQLDPLFPTEAGIRNLNLNVLDPHSVQHARELLKHSRLDESQASAVVDALSREIALIQGPPGTGKSYTGVELLRVLLPKAKPILMIAFTNHALDHMLNSVLDAEITQNIVRLGGRSADERISRFSLEKLEVAAGRSRLNRSFARYHKQLRDLEEEIGHFMKKVSNPTFTTDDILNHIRFAYPGHQDELLNPPPWVQGLREFELKEIEEGWETTKKNQFDSSLYGFWREGRDLRRLHAEREAQQQRRFVAAQAAVLNSQKRAGNQFALLQDHAEPGGDSFVADEEAEGMHDYETTMEEEVPLTAADYLSVVYGVHELPWIPDTDRPWEALLDDDCVWQMSLRERQKLHQYWIAEIKEREQPLRLQEYSDLRERHKEIFAQHQEARDEARRQLLLNVDIIGCTTTGAAKLTSLLKGLEPRILLVEEAGQVLEAHILGSLVPSVEHLILIGDPLQLRPTLNNYSLSIDSKTGERLYRFDMSLMERLSSSGFPMSRIDVQRRMRPQISSLIRNTLYPTLIDNDKVKDYPDVRGMVQNIFFLDHQNAENGDQDDTASKYNTYEVEMIKDLVLYLLKQGYSQDGDIVVLCAYLGQLARVRDALNKEVVVLIDDRDMQDLASREDEKEKELDVQPDISRVKASKQVRIRTVDNYQGEEAKIVILSLVRNAGSQARRQTIGFLKSTNRTNVALSRAKEGLYILGNAEQLRSSSSKMWRGVVDELANENFIGDAFPVACYRHPDTVNYINKPGQLRQLAPDGGCLLPCGVRLDCGHICPYKCHPDDPRHVAVVCLRPCTKLCARGHPCNKECSTPCGKCNFKVHDVELPCGHIKSSVACHMLDDLSKVYCSEVVSKKLPHCEHLANMECSANTDKYECRSACSKVLDCCGRNCKSTCGRCQTLNTPREDGITVRTKHQQHPCNKLRYCAHLCPNPCSPNHQCATTCKERCRQECVHTRCENHCSTPCAPCMEPCTWACAHHQCPVPCGSVCARLPCDRRCENILKCNHQCPSVCGEDCSIQKCPICASPDEKNQIVDFVMQRTLAEVAETAPEEGDILVTLPKCRHVFTMETLDGHCGINDWYIRRESDGKWVDLQTPEGNQLGSRKPPVCPTCRTAITSPRYGRIFKAADLQILEQNVIARMVQQLEKLRNAISGISKETKINEVKDAIRRLDLSTEEKSPDQPPAQANARESALASTRQTPIPLDHLMPDNNRLFIISSQVATVWKKLVTPITQAYASAMKVGNLRSAHIHAWEAAYTRLFEREMDLASMDPLRAPRNPHEYALRMARMKVGLPRPRADQRYLVEAFWIGIDIRFMLSDLVLALLKATDGKGSAFPISERESIGIFGAFILSSCQDDARRAYEIAQASNARRQMTTSALIQLRAKLEAFRFDLELSRIVKAYWTSRESLLQRAVQDEADTVRTILLTVQEHQTARQEDLRDWLSPNFYDKAILVRKEWEKIIESLREETFYEPVSLDEKLAIVNSLGFGYTGHFYTCPNGHVYVIGECGGAMQTSRCPECGATVGGSSHRLTQGNRRAEEFETLLRQAGAQRSPWAWAQ